MFAIEFLKELKSIDPSGKLTLILDNYDEETIERISKQFNSALDFIMEVESL